MLQKKSIFYFISFLIVLLVFEFLSTALINFIKKNPKIIKSKNFYSSEEMIKELDEYLNLIPYIDDALEFRKFISNEASEELFFDTHVAFNKKNDENILIQGDSWAAAANKLSSKEKINKIMLEKKFGLINSGKTSYSISPMNIQLDILINKFKIKPSIIIAIVDQTDIGDELHRYQSLDKKSLDLTDTKISSEFKKKFFTILDARIINSLKIFLLFKEFWISRLNQFDNNVFKTIKYCFSRLFYLISNTPTVLAPLKYGINEDENRLIKSRYEKYIDNVFKNKIKRLIFVSHPHKNHIENNYKTDIETIIDDVIKTSKYKDKILHIKFSEKFYKIYKNKSLNEIFIISDVTSHLTDDAYREIYFPQIFSVCCN